MNIMEKCLGLRKLLKEKKYDVVINPGLPDGLFINDLIVESKRFKIPLIYIMNSWDNPSTAPFASGIPDLFLAWGQQTANHANIYQIRNKTYINPSTTYTKHVTLMNTYIEPIKKAIHL